jgi:hypothetical protein
MTGHQHIEDTILEQSDLRRQALTNRQAYEKPAFYQIRVQGTLDQSWSDWFDGITFTQQDSETLLAGVVIDQAALHGILAKLNDLGLTIISVERREP